MNHYKVQILDYNNNFVFEVDGNSLLEVLMKYEKKYPDSNTIIKVWQKR